MYCDVYCVLHVLFSDTSSKFLSNVFKLYQTGSKSIGRSAASQERFNRFFFIGPLFTWFFTQIREGLGFGFTVVIKLDQAFFSWKKLCAFVLVLVALTIICYICKWILSLLHNIVILSLIDYII